MSTAARDRKIVDRLVHWFDRNSRALPWRNLTRRDAYHALVSEAMLQQTQVSRVLESFDKFIARFPTIEALAKAREQSVLAAWSGLGYYRRARSLHRAAQQIVAEHQGVVPTDVESLRSLPGVGRYTAGAISSIVFNHAEPIVDGNVARVLLRLEGETIDPSTRAGDDWLWSRASSLVKRAAAAPDSPVGPFNEGLMELGALVCKPAGPTCSMCPLSSLCRSRRLNLTDVIPKPKAAARRQTVHHACVLLENKAGRRLVTRRLDDGLWARMWQPPTLESSKRQLTRRDVEEWVGASVEQIAHFDHVTSHRLVRFSVWRSAQAESPSLEGSWRTPGQIANLALSNPHRRILLEM
jgi:A/G-specific adenine glycosylase